MKEVVGTEMTGHAAGAFVEVLASIGNNVGMEVSFSTVTPDRVVAKVRFAHEAGEELFRHSLSDGVLKNFKHFFLGL